MAVSEEQQKPVEVDVTKLTPLSPEVISKQATINIGSADADVADDVGGVLLMGFMHRYDWSRSPR